MSYQDRPARDANRLFQQGNYEAARALYQKAALKYGETLFHANIALCEARAAAADCAERRMGGANSNVALREQLKETQSLLEYYFQRCETLEGR